MIGLTLILPWPIWLYLLMSLVTLVVYFLDKSRAARGAWRFSERTLHLLELMGGWPGALIAQRLFHHKWRKRGYMLIFWAIVAGHIAFWLWYRRWIHF